MTGKLHITKDGDTSAIDPDAEVGVITSVISAEFSSPAEIKRSARAFVKLATKYPDAECAFALHAFGDEERSPAERLEVLELVQRWAEEVRRMAPAVLARLEHTSSMLLMVAEGRGEYVPLEKGRGYVNPIAESKHVH